MNNDDNLESNLLASSLLERHLVYILVQDELTIREQVIHQIKLIYAAGRLVAVIIYCLKYSLNLLVRINDWKDNGVLMKSHNCRCGRLVV